MPNDFSLSTIQEHKKAYTNNHSRKTSKEKNEMNIFAFNLNNYGKLSNNKKIGSNIIMAKGINLDLKEPTRVKMCSEVPIKFKNDSNIEKKIQELKENEKIKSDSKKSSSLLNSPKRKVIKYKNDTIAIKTKIVEKIDHRGIKSEKVIDNQNHDKKFSIDLNRNKKNESESIFDTSTCSVKSTTRDSNYYKIESEKISEYLKSTLIRTLNIPIQI